MPKPARTIALFSLPLVLAGSLLLSACDSVKITDPATLLEHAATALARKNTDQAITLYKQVLKQAPGHAEARYGLGQVYMELDDFRTAELQFRRTLSSGLNTPRVRLSLLQSLLSQNKYSAVIDESEKYPDTELSVDVLNIRGESFLGNGENNKAEQSFVAALAQDPGSVDASLGLARIALQRERLDDLEKYILPGLPLVTEAWYMKGLLETLRGNPVEAEAAFTEVSKRRPDDIPARLGIVRARIGAGNYASAQTQLEEILSKHPEYTEAHYLAALNALRNNEPASAISHAREALARNPQHIPAHAVIGTAHFSTGHLEQATLYLKRYTNEVPENIPARITLASAYVQLGHPRDALSILEPLFRRDPENAALRALLGAAYLQDEQAGQAIDYISGIIPTEKNQQALRNLTLLARLSEDTSGELGAHFHEALADTDYGLRLAEETGKEHTVASGGTGINYDMTLDELMYAGDERPGDRYRANGSEQDDLSFYECEKLRALDTATRPTGACRDYDEEVSSILSALGQLDEAPGTPALRSNAPTAYKAAISPTTPSAQPQQVRPELAHVTFIRTVQRQIADIFRGDDATRENSRDLLRNDVVQSQQVLNEGYRDDTGTDTESEPEELQPERSGVDFQSDDEDKPWFARLLGTLLSWVDGLFQFFTGSLRNYPWLWGLALLGALIYTGYDIYRSRKAAPSDEGRAQSSASASSDK